MAASMLHLQLKKPVGWGCSDQINLQRKVAEGR
jgi:hypothetical protein